MAVVKFANNSFHETLELSTETKFKAACELQCEDNKTALARDTKPIPKGATVSLIKFIRNFFGLFAYVEYEDTKYYIKPESLMLED